MNVLLIGSGGREHALAWKMAQSPLLKDLYIAPGNPGTSSHGLNVNVNIKDISELCTFIETNNIDFVVVGPEEPLVNGIHDKIMASDLQNKPVVIGPKAEGAILEGSKKFSKEFMEKHNIPTARYQSFDKTNITEAKAFLAELSAPYVLKADGLAAGKGVLIIDNEKEAYSALQNMIENQQFGSAGDKVVIEEFLDGIELSVFVLTDGKSYIILPSAKDYKRIGEGDKGLNTGGMGAISPAPSSNPEFMRKVEEKVIQPTINGFIEDDIEYQGFIFIGLMDVGGEPLVIEYNVRLGDPETEAILPRINSDLLELFQAVKDRTIADFKIDINEKSSCTIMMVSGGYPEAYDKGFPITGIDNIDDALLFQAGTALKEGVVVSNGGRVLAVTNLNSSIKEARSRAYTEIHKINFKDHYYRKDIGYEVL